LDEDSASDIPDPGELERGNKRVGTYMEAWDELRHQLPPGVIYAKWAVEL
jgi:hypothetical protein